MNNQTIGSTLAPMGGLMGTSKNKLSVTISEADNGFILNWYDPQEGTRTHLCLTLEEVGIKFTELFPLTLRK